MDAFKTLFDLSLCLNKAKDAKIQKKACHLFHVLSNHNRNKTDGLLYNATGNPFSQHHFPKTRAEAIEQANFFFHSVFKHENPFLSKYFINFNWKNFFRWGRRRNDLQFIDKLFNEVIWRNIFSGSLNVAFQSSVLANNFCFTDLSLRPSNSLNTQHYDFVIFHDIKNFQVSDQSTKILYVQNDLVEDKAFYSTIKQICADSFVVFDSESNREKLVKSLRCLTEKSVAIPCSYETTDSFNHIATQWINLFEKIKIRK
ncbi:MAG: hypothetical protein ACYCQI_04620 [Gammaproteobacteria bacterium]